MTADEKPVPNLKTLTAVIYGLYGLALLTGITAIVAIVLNYLKREEVQNTWLQSHFSWQIRTFWWGVAWMILGTITYLILIGWAIWGVATVWYIYRIAKGWLNLNDGKPMPLT
ncbi:MAG: hypothetical protein ABL877_02005 [Thiobacillus sp.]